MPPSLQALIHIANCQPFQKISRIERNRENLTMRKFFKQIIFNVKISQSTVHSCCTLSTNSLFICTSLFLGIHTLTHNEFTVLVATQYGSSEQKKQPLNTV